MYSNRNGGSNYSCSVQVNYNLSKKPDVENSFKLSSASLVLKKVTLVMKILGPPKKCIHKGPPKKCLHTLTDGISCTGAGNVYCALL
jgi:hypothetical protein